LDLLRLLNESGGVNKSSGGVKPKLFGKSGGVKFTDQLLYQTIDEMPGLNAPALAVMLNISLRTVQRYLKKLTDEGKITYQGAAKTGGYYKIK
jgi:Fic family protein